MQISNAKLFGGCAESMASLREARRLTDAELLKYEDVLQTLTFALTLDSTSEPKTVEQKELHEAYIKFLANTMYYCQDLMNLCIARTSLAYERIKSVIETGKGLDVRDAEMVANIIRDSMYVANAMPVPVALNRNYR